MARPWSPTGYSDGEGPHEAIELGNCIPVLVLEQAILAFAICLDFCNLPEDPPYPDLDIDYVIVPSCGGASTMQGHIRRSSVLLAKLKSRTMVVQQYFADRRGRVSRARSAGARR